MKFINVRLLSTLVLMGVVSATSFYAAKAEAQQQTVEPDFFARFKYSADEAVSLLRSANGRPLVDSPAARQLLDDMGYWTIVRQTGDYSFTQETEAQIRAQYAYLERAFRYDVGDLVWIAAQSPAERPYGIAGVNHRAQIIDQTRIGGTDFFVVNVLLDGSDRMKQTPGRLYDGRTAQILYYGDNYALRSETRLLTKAELDRLNSPGSSLPVDNVGERLDWNGDTVWKDKIETFRARMAAENFQIDWLRSPAEIESKQANLMVRIFRHFKMNRNAPSNNGRGIGLRSSGGGVCFDQALVLTYAVQAVGQSLGLKAVNLNGTTVNPMGGHGFVRVDLKGNPQQVTFDRVTEYSTTRGSQSQQLYAGVTLSTSVRTAISDPGWADYGVTPDQFAFLPISEALNTNPVDANRAVNGTAPQRPLTEVTEQLRAKGPLATFRPQTMMTLDPTLRARIVEDYTRRQSQNEPQALEEAMESSLKSSGVKTCRSIFGAAQ